MNTIHLRIEKENTHVHYSIFVDGAKSGELVMRAGEEAKKFEDVMLEGCLETGVEFLLTPLGVAS